MEILAPAGSRDALDRAIAAGADAVYLGFSAFSARAGAGNFDEPALREALRVAHLHHVRVYVTVNTLIKDQELPEALALLALLNELRADGVLVQDLGVLRQARSRFPGLRIHASTQMAIHNETGVLWCAEMGMKRVVLARECSLEEIRRCAGTGMEIEVFGHGAQCVSVSGECLFSSMVGDRSGNRGRCAQPCRKRYRFDGQEGAWLSPRDLSLRDRIPELAEAGAASLKIEGRLKRPEYVYTVADSYRRGRDSLEKGGFRPMDAEEQEKMAQVFHRGGFMAGYAFGTEDAGVIAPGPVNHQGIRIGRVTGVRGNLASVQLNRPLHDGDGLRLRHGAREAEMTYAGRETPAGETAVLRLREGLRAEQGDEVWRLTDARLNQEAMAAPLPGIPVELRLEAWPGKALTLILSDGESEVTVAGDIVSAARSRESAPEEMEKQLRKTGGTDFEARDVTVHTAGAFVPVSLLNSLRREGLARLAEARVSRFAYPETPEQNPETLDTAREAERGNAARVPKASETDESEHQINPAALKGNLAELAESKILKALPVAREVNAEGIVCSEEAALPPETSLMATVRKPAQAAACRGKNVRVVWYPEDFREDALEAILRDFRAGDWLRLPEVCEEETLRMLHRFVMDHRDLLGGVMLGSVGQLGLQWPVPIGAGPGIPVMNREAARLLRERGCVFVMASPELTGEELKTLMAPGPDLPVIAFPAYGRTQLMLLHHCPARTAQGWTQGHAACRLCDEDDPRALRGKALEDERGYRFPLQRIRLPEGCLVRLLNALPTDLGDRRIQGLRAVEMTAETGEEAEAVLARLLRYEKAPGESTRGHWTRPVL